MSAGIVVTSAPSDLERRGRRRPGRPRRCRPAPGGTPSATNRSATARPSPLAAPVMIGDPSGHRPASTETGSAPRARRCVDRRRRPERPHPAAGPLHLLVPVGSHDVDPPFRRVGRTEHVHQGLVHPLLAIEHVHDHLALGAVHGQLRPTRRTQPDEVEPRGAVRGQDAAGDPQRDPRLAPDQARPAGTAGPPGSRSPRPPCRPSVASRPRTRPHCPRTGGSLVPGRRGRAGSSAARGCSRPAAGR